jgi:predicted metal-dependent peptidase
MTYISLQDPEVGRLMKARSRLGSRAPGYAAIVFGLPFVETHRTQTMATDGKCIYFNRTFVQNSTDDELLAVLFHEGLHVSLGHHLRRGNIDPRLWNMAADYAINLIVREARLSLPDGALLDQKYRGLTAEQIARLLKQKQPDQPEQPQPPQGGDEGEGEGQGGSGAGDDTDDDQDQDDDGQGQGGDDADDGEGDAPSGAPDDFDQPGEIWDAVDDAGERLGGDDLEKAEETLRRDVIVASMAEKAAGSGTITLDGGVVEAAKAATVDWVEAMADFLNRAYAGEPTLAKPARRHLWEGNYFPSMQGVGGGDLVIAIDTSGSVSQDEAEQFASEIDAIREMIKPDRTCVIYCDSHIQKSRDGQSYDVFDSYEDIEVRRISGGGTRFDPPFHLVDQEGLEPHAFIYFTDGYAVVDERTADVVDYPVLWATTGVEPSFRGQEFGEVIKLTM